MTVWPWPKLFSINSTIIKWINCSMLNWAESTAARCLLIVSRGKSRPSHANYLDRRWEQECDDHGDFKSMFVFRYPFGECQQKRSKNAWSQAFKNANRSNWVNFVCHLDLCAMRQFCMKIFSGGAFAHSKWDMTACMRHACWPEDFVCCFDEKHKNLLWQNLFVCPWVWVSDDGLHVAQMASDEILSYGRSSTAANGNTVVFSLFVSIVIDLITNRRNSR